MINVKPSSLKAKKGDLSIDTDKSDLERIQEEIERLSTQVRETSHFFLQSWKSNQTGQT